MNLQKVEEGDHRPIYKIAWYNVLIESYITENAIYQSGKRIGNSCWWQNERG